jgi:hypothetical protein
MSESEQHNSINVMTEEGQRLLAELAADKPIFRVRHACDQRED